MKSLLRLRSPKSIHSIITQHNFFISHCVFHSAIIAEDYYKQSNRFDFDRIDKSDQLSVLDQIDYDSTVRDRNNMQQYSERKKIRKRKTELRNKNVYINQLFEHREYYESKSQILKQQIKCINDYIEQFELNSLDFDLEIIRKEMLRFDVSLKLKEIHRVLDEHSLCRDKVCTDGQSKEEFAKAVVDGTYNKVLATQTTQYWRSQIMKREYFRGTFEAKQRVKLQNMAS
eukprot:UN08592